MLNLLGHRLESLYQFHCGEASESTDIEASRLKACWPQPITLTPTVMRCWLSASGWTFHAN